MKDFAIMAGLVAALMVVSTGSAIAVMWAAPFFGMAHHD